MERKKITWADFIARVEGAGLIVKGSEPEKFYPYHKTPISAICYCGKLFDTTIAALWYRQSSCGCRLLSHIKSICLKSKKTYEEIREGILLESQLELVGDYTGLLKNVHRKGAHRFKCRCGKEFGEKIPLKAILSGNTSSCGCYALKRKSERGRAKKGIPLSSLARAAAKKWWSIDTAEVSKIVSTRGLSLVSDLETRCHTRTKLEFKCSCGNPFSCRATDFVRGFVQSCGCLKSGVEDDIYSFVKEISPDAVKNTRKVIRPKEVDVWVPSKRLAVELNGLYWHGEKVKGPEAQRDISSKRGMLLEVGARPLFFFEDEWNFRKEAVKGYIRSILGKKTTVGARKCAVISGGREFIEKYHIQGSTNHTCIALTHNGEIVAAASFCRSSGSRSGPGISYELSRYCVGPDISVAGGLGKLLAEWRRRTGCDSVVTYSDNRLSQGQIYRASGFEEDGGCGPRYWYVRGKNRLHRFAFRKSELKRKGLLLEGETERACMIRLKYDRIWDAGKVRWVKTFTSPPHIVHPR